MTNQHDFFQLMAAVNDDILNDFRIVRRRSREDPGTAGDQVEEQWADVLRRWLPATYHIVTKGRILFPNETASPQVDILVLRPSYPLGLRNKKYFFSGGVLAAFECKLTLRARDLVKAFQTCHKIKKNTVDCTGTPQDELCKLPIFGVLAHSHDIRDKGNKSILYEKIEQTYPKFADHLSELVDIICVADDATIPLVIDVLIGPNLENNLALELKDIGETEAISAWYFMHSAEKKNRRRSGDALAVLISNLTRRLALHEPTIRDWADHLEVLGSYIGIGKPA